MFLLYDNCSIVKCIYFVKIKANIETLSFTLKDKTYFILRYFFKEMQEDFKLSYKRFHNIH